LILTFGLAAASAAEPDGQAGAGAAAWSDCQQAPTRRCVLRHAVEVALRLQRDANATSQFELAKAQQSALYGIAIAQLELGLTQEASETIDLVSTPQTTLGRARIKAAAGKLDEAARIAGAAPRRGQAIGMIAVVEGEAGTIDAALRRVQSVEDARERAVAIRRAAWGLRFIAAQRGEDGKLAEALRLSQSIKVPPHDPWTRVPALQIIVDAQIRTGRIAEAMQAVRSVEDARERQSVLASAMLGLAHAGRVSEALLAFDDPDERSRALGLTALTQLWRGTLAQEPLPINPLPSDMPMVGSLFNRLLDIESDRGPEIGADAADVQGKVDAEALAIARSISDRFDREKALRIVAMAQAKAGEPDQAAEAAKLITSESTSRFEVLLAVGLAQARAGQRAQAVATFDEAARFAGAKPSATLLGRFVDYLQTKLSVIGVDWSYLVPDLGIAEAKADLIAEAMAVAESIKGKGDRASVLSEVARAQARAGRTADALQTADIVKALGGGDWEVEELIVVGLAEGGHVGELIPTLERFSRSSERARLFIRVAAPAAAILLARAGNGSGAQRVAQMLEKTEPSAWIETLAQVALALRHAGADADAAAAIRTAMDSIASGPERQLPEKLAYLSYALAD